MRIVQLANFYSPTSGGLRVAVDVVRDGYLAAGHDCTLVVPAPRDEVDGTVRGLRAPRLPNGSGYRVILRRRAVLAMLDERRPDSVEVHDKLLQQWVWPWSRARRVPLLAVSHERLARTLPMLLPFVPARLLRAAAAAVTRRTTTRCDALVTCSRFAAEEFARHAQVIPLGVDLATFHPPERHQPAPRLRLVSAGRLSPEKRPDLAVETLRTLRARGLDADLTVVGDGPMRPSLERLADGLPVRFAGHVRERRVLASMLGAADVALACAPAETFGLAALEALACGTPIVAVAGAAPSEFVDGHPAAGRAAAPHPAAFACAAAEIAAVPDRRSAARRCAEGYPWSATVAALLDLHLSVADPLWPPAAI